MKKKLAGLIILTLAFAWPAAAQAVEDEPGYVDFGGLERYFDVEPTIEINIKGLLLRLVAEASRYEDPDLADMLRNVKGIFVRAFDLRRVDYDDVERQKRIITRRLEADGWETVVRVRDRDETTHMFVRIIDDGIAGMVVMTIVPRDDETVFLNIVGDIDPEQIGRIGRKFNISSVREW